VDVKVNNVEKLKGTYMVPKADLAEAGSLRAGQDCDEDTVQGSTEPL
jgi:hypothetical protein